MTYYTVTNVGLSFLAAYHRETGWSEPYATSAEILEIIKDHKFMDSTNPNFPRVKDTIEGFVHEGWLDRRTKWDSRDAEEVERRYKFSPLEHMRALWIELHYDCILNCNICYQGGFRDIEKNLSTDKIKEVINLLHINGLLDGEIYFSGGEPTIDRDDLLELVEFVGSSHDSEYKYRSLGHGSIFTNGWWGIDMPFRISGETFSNAEDFIRTLKDLKLATIRFSLDGFGEDHDYYRGIPGLYNRVMYAIETCKKVGMPFCTKTTLHAGIRNYGKFLEQLHSIHELPLPGSKSIDALEESLVNMKKNNSQAVITGFQPVGNACGVFNLDKAITLEDVTKGCKGYYRPTGLYLRPDGELRTCQFAVAGRGIGNVNEQPLLEILNGIQNHIAYGMHADHKLQEYAHLVLHEFFGTHFDGEAKAGPCVPWMLLSMIVNEVEHLERTEGRKINHRELLDINRTIAKRMGFAN